MIPDHIDPSLCSGEPQRDRLDDGFSPPPPEVLPAAAAPSRSHPEQAIGTKSPF